IEGHEELACTQVQITETHVLGEGVEDGGGRARVVLRGAEGELDEVTEIRGEEVPVGDEANGADVDLVAHVTSRPAHRVAQLEASAEADREGAVLAAEADASSRLRRDPHGRSRIRGDGLHGEEGTRSGSLLRLDAGG